MNHNYFNHLIESDFKLLHLGNWADKVILDAENHTDVLFVDESAFAPPAPEAIKESIICVKSDFEASIYRKAKNIQALYDIANNTGKRFVILGYRDLGVVKES
ncbi:hypothetical protein [Photobacterium galatheae]|uniref:Uncharacterized protein n=1 Tax=Photobacterium galatheae TaxID=1654360 RepID=A0A066RUB2_9GAMM|nr:hypothetical protein [Photobacterium galatheae]KDM90983.1 hypothetical protein EA58_14625 [Photobacterium galatheae]MCM0149060.1 hypothetical protein [Photobacterium galatheae]